MKSTPIYIKYNDGFHTSRLIPDQPQNKHSLKPSPEKKTRFTKTNVTAHAEVLVITSYPPRECGIATYSIDLIHSLKDKSG
jgi:hypothetical protein